MAPPTAQELFEKGCEFLDCNDTLAALSCFEKASGMEKIRGIQSYIGLCCAFQRGQITEGIRLCREAIADEPGNPAHYLHLGKIYLKERKKGEAIEILRKGLSFGDSEKIRRMLDALGTRKKPLIPFLPRSNLLNKYGGMVLKKLRIR